MKQFLSCFLAVAIGLFTGCTAASPPQPPVSSPNVVTLDNVNIVTGQTIYVPVYSHIYSPDRSQQMDLATTLSIRNTDLAHPIIILSVNYYNTNGEQVRRYLEQPVELRSLATIDFVVDRDDTSGGSGASFVVEWVAQDPVSNPVVEAVMINTSGNQGLSLISNGRVIKQRTATSP